LLDWQTYAEQFGLGIDRDDIHWGMLMSMLFNIHRDKDAPAKKATSFMPYYQEPDMPDVSQEDFNAQMKTLFALIPTT